MKKDLPITEQVNPKSKNIQLKSVEKILGIFNSEDERVPQVVKKVSPEIAKATKEIIRRFKQGGRVLMFGVGTSGRLAEQEAAECRTTFNWDETKIRGIFTSGRLEDNFQVGKSEAIKQRISANDTVIVLSASGSSKWALGVAGEAKQRKALTIGIACNKVCLLAKIVDIPILPLIGPEIIAGSTRMKAGTAQKMILNRITTLLGIKLGKVRDGYMIDFQPINQKLRNRATTVVARITNINEEKARQMLSENNWNLKLTIEKILNK